VPVRSDFVSPKVWLPYAYMRLNDGTSEVTLLDQRISGTPLSVNSTIVRGIHLDRDDLDIHAGYTSKASFQYLLFHTRKQLIVGGVYSHSIGGEARVGATAYFIQRDNFISNANIGQRVGTLFLKKIGADNHCIKLVTRCAATDFSLEVGFSRGI